MTPREAALVETLNATMSLNRALEEELFVIRNEESEFLKEARRTLNRAAEVALRREPTDTEVQKFWEDFRKGYSEHRKENIAGDDYAWHNLFQFQRDAIRACAKFFRG